MAKKQGPVSQSRTMWVKKGTVVNGKEVKKGYLAQYGRPEKKVTARVKIETATESGKKAGEVYRYKAGRTVRPSAKPRSVKTKDAAARPDDSGTQRTVNRPGRANYMGKLRSMPIDSKNRSGVKSSDTSMEAMARRVAAGRREQMTRRRKPGEAIYVPGKGWSDA